MESWKIATRRGLVSGAAASALSTAALAALGKLGTGSAFAPTNAVSHYVWGEKAAHRDLPSMRYTALGYTIHHLSATFWAVLFERFMGERLDRMGAAPTLAAAGAASAVACFADYQLTPERLQPGYEKRLSTPSLAIMYGAFGLGLAFGALMIRRR
ncbi:hypothetical protein [Massilia psychrophila]|uniref:DUF1440 domain-containing protein n=1 Tax=Massilia psychrophila TaxID=1603353 RepID=A0A2G8T1V1_9BURK|nr:hypothetical protein [Massilia psychrophila]PIL40030.1 hypothetical protein CR103_09930 [Massilia psychrophila]GGE79098.1 hypothetical protein GCM10008020_24850 [Massilia psychrophila]